MWSIIELFSPLIWIGIIFVCFYLIVGICAIASLIMMVLLCIGLVKLLKTYRMKEKLGATLGHMLILIGCIGYVVWGVMQGGALALYCFSCSLPWLTWCLLYGLFAMQPIMNCQKTQMHPQIVVGIIGFAINFVILICSMIHLNLAPVIEDATEIWLYADMIGTYIQVAIFAIFGIVAIVNKIKTKRSN